MFLKAVQERFGHLKTIVRWWWLLIAGLWSAFWVVNDCIGKWGSNALKTQWESATLHLPPTWQIWLIGLLVIGILLIVEGSYRHFRDSEKSTARKMADLQADYDLVKAELRLEKDRSLPKLSLLITQVATTPCGEANRDALLLLSMSIENTGAPSIVKNFSVSVAFGEKRIKADMLVGPIRDERVTLGDDGSFMELRMVNYLPNKVYENPIPSGGGAAGWFRALVSKAPAGVASTEMLHVQKLFKSRP
jgi:hypothetical protein